MGAGRLGVPGPVLQSEFATWLWRPKTEGGTQDQSRAEVLTAWRWSQGHGPPPPGKCPESSLPRGAGAGPCLPCALGGTGRTMIQGPRESLNRTL